LYLDLGYASERRGLVDSINEWKHVIRTFAGNGFDAYKLMVFDSRVSAYDFQKVAWWIESDS
jgi:hypothetical protein